MIINNKDKIIQLQNLLKAEGVSFLIDMIYDQSNERGDLKCL